MEILHENLPSIQTLDLDNLSIADSTMPANITPDTSLTNVKFDTGDGYRITDSYCRWYLYMSQKYVNVKEWRYLDRNQIYLGIQAEQFYNDEFLQLVQLVAQTQSYLSLYHMPASIYVFQHLDIVGARIENFDLRKCPEYPTFQNLANSNQSKCINNLNIMYSNLGSLSYFQNLKSLTTLTLEDQRDDPDSEALNLTGCLNAMPGTLKQLSFTHDLLEVDPVHCNSSSIQYLSIKCKDFTKALVDVVSTCFPKLIEVELSGGVNYDLKLTLPSQFLKSATFSLPYESFNPLSFWLFLKVSNSSRATVLFIR